MKTTDSKGVVLNWMIGKCFGVALVLRENVLTIPQKTLGSGFVVFNPAGNIAQAQSIIDQEGIDVIFSRGEWHARHPLNINLIVVGPTRELSAMRCLATVMLGSEISVPAEIERIDSLRNEEGKKISEVPKYAFTLRLDTALSIHNFHDSTYVRIVNEDNKAVWSLLDRFVLFEAKSNATADSDVQSLRIAFNGLKNIWSLDVDRGTNDKNHRRSIFGSLSVLMAEFEKNTGLDLPEVRLQDVGKACLRITAFGQTTDPVNPWMLQSGSYYELAEPSNTSGWEPLIRQFLVSQESTGEYNIVFLDDPNYGDEVFDPHVIFTGEDWLNLRPVSEEHKDSSKNSSRRAMRQSC